MCELIRLGKISRQEAIEKVKKYDGKCSDKFIKKFCDYLEIDNDKFWQIANSYRDLDIWSKNSKNEWKLKFKVH